MISVPAYGVGRIIFAFLPCPKADFACFIWFCYILLCSASLYFALLYFSLLYHQATNEAARQATLWATLQVTLQLASSVRRQEPRRFYPCFCEAAPRSQGQIPGTFFARS